MLSSSDIDFSPEIKTNPSSTNVYNHPNKLRLYTIQNASCHVVQSDQQENLAKYFE